MIKRAGDIFSVLFDERHIKKANEFSAFSSCWKDLVEKNGIAAAAAHSRIKTFEKGLVWIEVDHPGWKHILQTKKSKLLSDFHYRFPKMDISGISIMLCRPGNGDQGSGIGDRGPAGDVGQAAEHACVQKKSPRQEAPPDSGYDAIKDKALRDVLMRLERTIIEREG